MCLYVKLLSEENNIYGIGVSNKPYFLINKKKREESIILKLGTMVLFPNFPFIDKTNEKKINFRNHYFTIIAADNKNFYLSYITTKTTKFTKNKYKNNNYIIISSNNDDNKKILISSRKIYKIKKKFFYKLLSEHKILINKALFPEIRNVLKTLIKNSEHIQKDIKNNINFSTTIYKKDINYPVDNQLKEQNKEELEVAVLVGNSIRLYSNY